MKSELREFVGRARRYQNIDGTGEMVVGLTILGFALAGYLETFLHENSPTWIRVVVVYASLALAMGLAYWTRHAIKRRITWPRTGYSAYRGSRGSRWIKTVVAGFSALIASVALAFLIKRGHVMSIWNLNPKTWNPRVVPLIVVSVVAYAIWIKRMGEGRRWKWLVLLSMILGIVTFALLVPSDFGQWARPPVLLVALLWLGSGIGTLYSYVRHNKPPAPEIE